MNSNEELIKHLIAHGPLHSPEIIKAFQSIDRRNFVRLDSLCEAYEDYALDIGYQATISQPTTVAFMLEQLEAESGDKVLDVGAGSGWTTALLGYIVGCIGSVYGVELKSALVSFAEQNIAKYTLPNIRIIQATKALGWPAAAPYDKILVSASTSNVPQELLTQLSIGGIMVIPIKNSIWKITKKSAVEQVIKKYPGFIFVPLQKKG